MPDDSWEPTGKRGMLISGGEGHKFLRCTFRKPTKCKWCRGFIWGLGKQGLKCAECSCTIHKKCEIQVFTSSDESRKRCSKAVERRGRDRATFSFKVKTKFHDALLEVDPSSTPPCVTIYVNTKSKQQFPCTSIRIEKPPNSMRSLEIRGAGDDLRSFLFASRREREQFAACARYLSQGGVARPISSTPLKVFMGSWNMGDAPPPDSLEAFIDPAENYDLVCVCAQEAEYKARNGAQSCEEDWFRCVERCLGSKYVRVAGYSLWSIRVVVLVRKDHRDTVSNIKFTREATGIAGVAGNKGGVAIACQIRETKLCFVGCHLAAHQEKVAQRNSDFFEIIEGCTGLGWKDFWITNEFHHIFWSGDLNYRIAHDRSQVVQMSMQGPTGWHGLYPYDQLQDQLGKENVFIEFNESQPLFQPTYRYARGQNIYPDDAKQRIPSWCDRVLWKSLSDEHIVQESYTSCQTVLTSDHRPVLSVFEIRARNQYFPPSVLNPLTSPAVGGLIDVWDSEPRSYFMIRNLAGHDLDSKDHNGKSDPYVTFVSRALQDTYKTSVKYNTLNPSWEGGEKHIPYLYLTFDEPEYLESEYLFFSVYDYDRTSPDDPLGQAHLSLKGLSDGKPHNFCVRLLGAGAVSGILTGTLQFISGS